MEEWRDIASQANHSSQRDSATNSLLISQIELTKLKLVFSFC